MPTTPKKKVSTTAPSVKREAVGSNINQPASPAGAGWSNAQKGELFEHVCKIGETDWASAVAGKTAQQVG
jgi:hypothetical protein